MHVCGGKDPPGSCALRDQQPVYLEWTPEFKERDRKCDGCRTLGVRL